MKQGRPPLPDKVRVMLTLDKSTVAAARALGNGSISAGVRAAFLTRQTSNSSEPLPPSADTPQIP